MSWENPSDMNLTGPVNQEVEIISTNGITQQQSLPWDGQRHMTVTFSDVDTRQSYLISVKHISELGLGKTVGHDVQQAKGLQEHQYW